MTTQRVYSGETAGLQALLDSDGQRQQYIKCMHAYGWSAVEEASQPSSHRAPIQDEAKQLLPKLRESESLAPICGLGFFSSAPEVVTAVSERAQAAGLRPGDRMVAVDGQRISPADPSEGSKATIARKRPGDMVRLTVTRAGREREVKIECADRRPSDKALMLAVEATAEGRWKECVSEGYEFERLTGPSALAAYLRLACSAAEQAASGRPTNMDDAALVHQHMRRRLSEAALSPGGVESVRGEVLKAISLLNQAGFPAFAEDLRSQLDSSGTSTGSDGLGAEPAVVSAGTCFIVTPRGLILTAHHLIANARTIKVHLADGQTLDAAVEEDLVAVDLTLLRVNSPTLKFLPLSPPRSARVGQPVFTLGFPATSILGEEPKFTDGSISALSGPGSEVTFLQVSVPVQPGNSGGPLVNNQGEVVGVMTATAAIAAFVSETGALPQNVNWAVKSDYARPLFDAPVRPPVAATRQSAIDRVRSALCSVEAARE